MADDSAALVVVFGKSAGNGVKDIVGRLFLISGSVQGVGYRAFAAQAAGKAGVSGWARNLSDGRVEIEASGTERQLAEFEALLRTGPRFADVQSVDVMETAVFHSQGFIIRS